MIGNGGRGRPPKRWIDSVEEEVKQLKVNNLENGSRRT